MQKYTFEGQEYQFDDDISLEEVIEYINSQQGPFNPPPSADAGDRAAIEAGKAYMDQAPWHEKLAIGAGKAVSDVVDGVSQLVAPGAKFLGYDGEASMRRIEAERRIYGESTEGFGVEDIGEVLGNAGVYLGTGVGGAGVKGSAIMGGLIEGLKATDDGSASSRLVNAGVGALLGGAGAKLGQAMQTKQLRAAAEQGAEKLGPIASRILDESGDAFTGKAMVEAAANPGAKRVMGGLGTRIFGRLSVRGTSETIARANALANATRETVRMSQNSALAATEKELYAQQAKQLADLQVVALKRLRAMYRGLTPEAQEATIYESIEQTIKEVAKTTTKTASNSIDEVGTRLVRQPKVPGTPRGTPAQYLPQQVKGTTFSGAKEAVESAVTETAGRAGTRQNLDQVLSAITVPVRDGSGRVGIDPTKFMQLLGFANKELLAALPPRAQGTINSVANLLQRNKGVLTTEEITAQLATLARLNDASIKKMIEKPINEAQKKAANAVLDWIISSSKLSARGAAGAAAGTERGLVEAAGLENQDLIQLPQYGETQQ